MGQPILEVRGLGRSFGGLRAVQDLTFSVEQGSVKAIIGPNGAGKTTVFNLIAGSLVPDSGSIAFRGTPIAGRKPHRIAAMGIARTFQTTKLFRHMTVLENVMVGRHSRSSAGFIAGMLNLPHTWREERAIRARAAEILEKLGIERFSKERAGNLSFGQQRMVEFARALAAEPKLLLLDEPAAGLNIHETGELAKFIVRIRGWGVTILVVEHAMSLVMDISHEIVVLDHGHKIAEGLPAEIQKDPGVIRVYLGEDNA